MSLMFYAAQSSVSDPGAMAGWLDGLPADLAALRRIARGLVVHVRGADLAALGIPSERVAEIDTRDAEAMLRRLHLLDGRPLAIERAPQRRLVGCCRDFTVLYLTLLRSRGIPARARVGFARYLIPGWYLDHEIAEVWDAVGQRWRLVDVQLPDTFVDGTDGASFGTLDVPRDRFLVAGDAWVAGRDGAADPARFVVDPGLENPATRGWPYLRHNLVHDLAALNKHEMLLWDTWGLIEVADPTERERALLDRVAAVTRAVPPSFAAVRSLYAEEPTLAVSPVVRSHSPAAAQPLTVSLERRAPESVGTPVAG